MDEQSKNNDTFTIRPLEWEPVVMDCIRATPIGGVSYQVTGYHSDVWEETINALHVAFHPTKEAAMAACEQHWRAEIEPALVRVEDGRDALLGRALEALQSLLDEQNGAPLCNREKEWELSVSLARRSIAEIEQAISAKEASV